MDKIKPMTQVQGHMAICSEVKVFVTKLDKLSWIPKTHKTRTDSHKLFSELRTEGRHTRAYLCTCTHTYTLSKCLFLF